MTPIEQYIRARAPQYEIDPDVAVRVALSEGGLTDPFRQSDVMKNGVREQSYGPFQLYMGGGLGNRAVEAGIDPRKDWQGGIDYALAEAGKKGWGQWYGAAKAGIGDRQGIGGYTGTGPTGAGTTLTSNPVAGPTTPGAVAPAAPEQSILEKLLGAGGVAEDVAGASGGASAGADYQPIPTNIQAHSGSEGAAQLLAELLQGRRQRYGTTLSGMGM